MKDSFYQKLAFLFGAIIIAVLVSSFLDDKRQCEATGGRYMRPITGGFECIQPSGVKK